MEQREIRAVNTDGYQRLIAVSDLHGNLELLRRLLEKVQFGERDLLLFVGDYVERGPQNAATLDYVMELAQKPNVFCLAGNFERFLPDLMDKGYEHFEKYCKNRPTNLWLDWAAELGLEGYPEAEYNSRVAAVKEHSKARLDWMRGLPAVLETNRILFVHAGVEEREDWQNGEVGNTTRNQTFLQNGRNLTGKWVVVGHMPAYNAARVPPSNRVLIDRERKIIGIDGGCGVKEVYQLNALMISLEGDEPRFCYESVDDFPRVKVKKSWRGENTWELQDMWPHYRLELLRKGEYFTFCRLKNTNRCGYVKNEHMNWEDGSWWYRISSVSHLLTVEEGETVALLDSSCKGFALVKNIRDEMGWVPHDVLARQVE